MLLSCLHFLDHEVSSTIIDILLLSESFTFVYCCVEFRKHFHKYSFDFYRISVRRKSRADDHDDEDDNNGDDHFRKRKPMPGSSLVSKTLN